MEIALYTTKKCGICKQAKDFLDKLKIDYEEYDMGIGGNPILQEVKKKFKVLGLKEYPVLIIAKDKKILQGFDEKQYKEVFGDKL